MGRTCVWIMPPTPPTTTPRRERASRSLFDEGRMIYKARGVSFCQVDRNKHRDQVLEDMTRVYQK